MSDMSSVAEIHSYLSVNLGGKEIPLITDAVVNMFIITAVLCIVVVLLTRKLSTVPTGPQKVAEMFVDFMSNLAHTQIGHHYKSFVPFLSTLLLFIFTSNILAIFNIIPTGETLSKVFHNPALAGFELELHPPTKNFNVTLCLALVSIVVVIIAEFKYKGIKGWLQSFYKPSPIFGFVKILDYIVRPMSLCLRLFGNILGGYIVMTLLYHAFPFLLPAVIGVYFDLFDGGLQAYVFVFLTMLYLSEAVEPLEEA